MFAPACACRKGGPKQPDKTSHWLHSYIPILAAWVHHLKGWGRCEEKRVLEGLL